MLGSLSLRDELKKYLMFSISVKKKPFGNGNIGTEVNVKRKAAQAIVAHISKLL